MIVEGIVSARVMKYGRRNSDEEEEELHVAKRGKKRDCPFGVEMRSFLGSGRVSEKVLLFALRFGTIFLARLQLQFRPKQFLFSNKQIITFHLAWATWHLTVPPQNSGLSTRV